MPGQSLLTNIIINATMGSGFQRATVKLAGMLQTINQITKPLQEFEEDSLKVYRNYEQSMADAEGALARTYGEGSTQLQKVMGTLDEYATEWAASTIFHTNDIGNAIAQMAHGGYDMEEIISGMPAAMRLAQAGSMDLSEAVDYIVKSQREFGLENEEMSGFIDMWAYAANSSATDIGEMGDAILRMGNTVRFASDPSEIFTMLGALANAGTTGETAGTLLRNAMLRLIAPTDKASEAMAALGVSSEEWEEASSEVDPEQLQLANEQLAEMGFSAYDANGNLRPMTDIFRDLGVCLANTAGGFDNITRNEDALQILSAIFPTRTMAGGLALIQSAQENYGDLFDTLNSGGAEGYGQYVADVMMDTLGGKIEIFESKVEHLKQVVGEELSLPAGNLLEVLGNFIDGITGLDPGVFDALVSGLSTLAGAGAVAGTAGGAMWLISKVANPLTLTVTAAIGLVSALNALQAYSDADFRLNFGTMELDMTQLKTNVDNLTTEGEEILGVLEPYTQRISEAGTTYQEAMTNFSAEIHLFKLTDQDTLSEEDLTSLQSYGKQATDAVLEGIQAARLGGQSFLNMIIGDTVEEGEFETYQSLYESEESYYSGLESEARQIGEKLQAALTEPLKDGMTDADRTEVVKGLMEDLASIQAQIAAAQSQQEYYEGLSRASRVSYDTMEEYMEYLSENQEERTDNINELYDSQEASARMAMEYNLERPMTDEEWLASDEFQMLEENRQEALAQIQQQTGQLAQAAFGTLMADSDMSEAWNFLQRVAEENGGENGPIDYANIDWQKYYEEGAIPENFGEALQDMQHRSGAFGWLTGTFTGGDLERMMEPWEGVEGVDNIVSLLSETGPEIGAAYADWNANIRPLLEQPPETQELMIPSPPTMQNFSVQQTGEEQTMSFESAGNVTGQEVTAVVNGDTGPLNASIQDENGQTIYTLVDGDASQLANIIDSYNGRTITVTITGRNLIGNVGGAAGPAGPAGYAEGGRASVPSIFGEAGAEWAIPERHDSRTAELLREAAGASGFELTDLMEGEAQTSSLPDLSGYNTVTNTQSNTLVYSPTINAADTEGVDGALRDDKKRLDRWYREMRTREEMEVFA